MIQENYIDDFLSETEDYSSKKKIKVDDNGIIYICQRCGEEYIFYKGNEKSRPQRCDRKIRRKKDVSYNLPCNGILRKRGSLSFRKELYSDILKCSFEVPERGFKQVIHKLYSSSINYDVIARELNLIYRMRSV